MSIRQPETDRATRGWALALTSVGFFMGALDALVVITALPAIQHRFRADVSILEWTVNAYALAAAAGIITAAALGDRLGRRRVFAAGLALFTAASAACAMAPSAELLVAARAVQGLGAAVIAPLSLTILTAAFPAQRRGAIVGIWGGIAGLAIASGPLVGGAVTQGLDWHWIFWVNVPIGLAAVILSVLRLPESYGPTTRLDLPGAGLVSGGAIAMVWALVRANDVGWGNPEIASTGSAGILLIAGFLAWERRALQPMLPLQLFRNLAFTAANATGFLMTGSLMAGAFLISQYLQFVLGYSPLNAGLRFLPMTATPLLVAPVAGALSDRIGRRPVMVVGMLLMAAGLGLFALVGTVAVGYGQLILPLIVAGVGASMVFAAAPAATLSAVAPPDMGKASGTANTLQRFGGVFGIALATAVFAANGHLGTPALFDAGFRPALAVAAMISALGAITALGVATQRAHKAASQQAEPSAATVANA